MTDPKTILFIDDEAVVLEVAAQILKRLGYSVFEAQGPLEALDVFRAHHKIIDLVILDMIMPGMGGDDLYGRIREIKPDARVLLTSGYAPNGKVGMLLSQGCAGFIQKPFTVADLAGKIKEVFEKKKG